MAGQATAERAIRLAIIALLSLVSVRVSEAGAGSGPAPTASATPQTMGAAVKGEPFFGYGVDIELLGQPTSPLLNGVLGMQFNWVRQSVDWRELQSAPGTSKWDELDVAVTEVANRGLRLVLLIVGTPRWAGGTNDLLVSENQPSPGMDAWSGFMEELAGRYDGLVDAYQIGRMPDLSGGWNAASVAAHVRVVQLAHQAVSSRSPSALVVSAGVTADTGLGYLAAMYGAGLASHCDAIAVSVRGASAGTYEQVRQVMTANGDGSKPIWLTDVGWPVATDGSVCAAGLSEEQQSEALVHTVRTAAEDPSVQLVMVDNYNQSLVNPSSERACFSLMRSDWSARPAFLDLAQFRQEVLFLGAHNSAQQASHRVPQARLKPYSYQPDV